MDDFEAQMSCRVRSFHSMIRTLQSESSILVCFTLVSRKLVSFLFLNTFISLYIIASPDIIVSKLIIDFQKLTIKLGKKLCWSNFPGRGDALKAPVTLEGTSEIRLIDRPSSESNIYCSLGG